MKQLIEAAFEHVRFLRGGADAAMATARVQRSRKPSDGNGWQERHRMK
jgi:hypothetical protein